MLLDVAKGIHYLHSLGLTHCESWGRRASKLQGDVYHWDLPCLAARLAMVIHICAMVFISPSMCSRLCRSRCQGKQRPAHTRLDGQACRHVAGVVIADGARS